MNLTAAGAAPSSVDPLPASRGRAAVWRGPGLGFGIEDILLDPPSAGEVAVRMIASGVCHSDLHVVDDEWAPPYPLIMGHEGAAIVEALGPGVGSRPEDPAVGDLVVLAWTAPCGTCPACRRGQGFICARPAGGDHRGRAADVRVSLADGSRAFVFAGIGTMATHQVVDASAAIRVDPAMPADQACLVGCAITTGVGTTLWTAGVRPGETLVVLGLGGVGLAAVMGGVLAGAGRIVAVDREPSKLTLAQTLGATDVFHAEAPERTASAVRALLDGGADHVIEAIGLTSTVELAIDLARRGGTVTLAGQTPAGQRAGFDVLRFVSDAGRILGSNYGSAVPATAFPLLVGFAMDGRLPIDRLISEHITLEDLPAAFEAMRNRDGARRVVIF
jgi:S-(hydroxymethyl)glutathione dehydrogenase / alcohol dehydrogenase